jgi:hypothetical protein
MDLDDLHLWSGHQPHAGACTPPIVEVRLVLLDSRQPRQRLKTMQPGLLGRPAVVVGIAAGSGLLGLYFVGRFLMAPIKSQAVIELVVAVGCLLGAIGGVARVIELVRQSRRG